MTDEGSETMSDNKKFNRKLTPTLYQKAVDSVCNGIDTILNCFLPEGDPKFISGPFAPVEEGELVRDIPVKGLLPPCLNGDFIRVGPNPKFKPTGNYHWFDGDGMLHGVRIAGGKASYVNRYVRTSRLAQEEMYGAAKFLKIGDMSGLVGLGKIYLWLLRQKLGVVDPTNGFGTANTALTFQGGRLMALQEADAPYIVKVLEDGEFETVGRTTFGGTLNHAFTAHPKVDPITGEMFAFGYNSQSAPYLVYRVVSKEGKMEDPVPITIPRPVLMHDFAITENYAIFLDLPMVFKPEEIVKSGFPYKYDPSIKARFGVLPRYAKNESQMKWFTLPSLYIIHTANAWEEGSEVVLIACHVPNLEFGKIAREETEEDHISTLHEFRFNMETGEASMRQLADFFSDFPRINENFVGRKQCYVYCSVMRLTKVIGVAKYDLEGIPEISKDVFNNPRVGGTCVGYFPHGENRFGSEPVFVPSGNSAEEDDGYLLNFVHDEGKGVSEMVVVNAKTMSPEPVAVVTIPRRMPYGFHGIFISEEQIKEQLKI